MIGCWVSGKGVLGDRRARFGDLSNACETRSWRRFPFATASVADSVSQGERSFYGTLPTIVTPVRVAR